MRVINPLFTVFFSFLCCVGPLSAGWISKHKVAEDSQVFEDLMYDYAVEHESKRQFGLFKKAEEDNQTNIRGLIGKAPAENNLPLWVKPKEKVSDPVAAVGFLTDSVGYMKGSPEISQLVIGKAFSKVKDIYNTLSGRKATAEEEGVLLRSSALIGWYKAKRVKNTSDSSTADILDGVLDDVWGKESYEELLSKIESGTAPKGLTKKALLSTIL